jgi:CheY-like chemotaxis protein/anti-sigma regulatory factor (Ser/Thr protein kinase)
MPSILVVDDDRSIREMIRGLLEAEGYAVSACADGLEALEHIGRHDFDLVLVDVWMPGLNGIELLARMRMLERRPPVVVMTADEAPETLLRAVREQAARYLRKPIDRRSLLEVVRSLLAAPAEPLPIEVLSAKPDWIELRVPCDANAADRIQEILSRLDTDLPEPVRQTVGQAFRELLMNAIEWGGRLDPTRHVRVSYLRARRMLLYRISDPGPGFVVDDLRHAAVANPEGAPYAHVQVREEKGLRAGGFGLLLARALVDELLYNEAHNEVVFVKYLD